jgi:hypothetical protein
VEMRAAHGCDGACLLPTLVIGPGIPHGIFRVCLRLGLGDGYCDEVRQGQRLPLTRVPLLPRAMRRVITYDN